MSKHPQHGKALRVLFAYPDGIDARDLSEDRRALLEVLVKIPQKSFFFLPSFFAKTSCVRPPKML